MNYRAWPDENPELSLRGMVESHSARVREAELARGALVVFMIAQPPEAYRAARVVQEGAISVVVIRVNRP